MAKLSATHGSALLLATLLLFSTGCLRAISDKPLVLAPEQLAASADKPAQATGPAEPLPEALSLQEVEQLLTTKVTRPDKATRLPTTVVVDGWYRQISGEETWTCPPGLYRWQHDGLAALRKGETDYAAALRTGSKSQDKFVRAAAQIGLARLAPAKSAKSLATLARNQDLTLGVRRAAVETLSRSTVLETEAQLRSLLDQLGPTENDIYPEPLLYAEVLAGLARHVAVDQDPLFTLALSASDREVQLAALTLWGNAQRPQLPEEVAALVKSPQARVRCAALRALAAGEDPGLLEQLQAATGDTDLQVRVTAIEMLGRVRQPGAVVLLQSQARHEQERHREVAVAALVEQQEWDALQQVTQDTSYRVRMALAVALAAHGDRQRVPLAQALLKDSSAMVQAKLCEALAAWPPELAVPLLFDGLASPNMLTRQAAQQALLKQQVAVQNFNVGAPPPERHQQLATLRTQWQKEHPVTPQAAAALATPGQPTVDEVAKWLKQWQTPGDRAAQWMARKQLERLGTALLPVLDQLTEQDRIKLEEATYRELLTAVSPSFQSIERLRATDVAQRRAAARELAQQAQLAPLSRLGLERLSSVARYESDPLVWADVLRAAGASPQLVAHELALAALKHGEADIRRRACEYLASAGDKRQGAALAPLLDDRDPVVRKAALVALGRCGPLLEREAVYALLAHDDIYMQVAAAKTLAQWHDERGAAALERMVLAATPASKRVAIGAMAELEDARYVDALVQALQDQPSVQLAALNALPKTAGQDPLQTASPIPVSAADKARVWQAWHAERR